MAEPVKVPEKLSFGALLRLGAIVGARLGALAGLGDALSGPLHPARFVYALGMNGLLGSACGAAAALLLSTLPSVRRGGVPSAAAGLAGCVAFPAIAAALAVLANRVLLRGAHFWSRSSLIADAIVVIVAAVLAVLLARVLRRPLASLTALRPPSTTVTLSTIAAIAATVVLPHLLPRGGHMDPARPSVVLVSIDTLRPDRLSTGGDPRGSSPEIDRLAREGLYFPEAITVSPGSAAAHAALLTSRYPISNGVYANFSVMDTSVTTLAEALRARGYRSGGFVTNTFLGNRFRFDQGFHTYVESGQVERLEEASPSALFRSLALVQIADRLRVRLQPGYDPSFETALRWIRESRSPSFFFVHLMDVHSPYAPPHPFGPRYGADRDAGRGATARRNRFGWRPSEPAYVAEVRFADTKIGRLRRVLEERQLLDSSVIVLTSDHGENLADHEPNFTHGTTVFDATLRILTSFRAPFASLRVGLEARILENVDVYPTIAALLGEPLPKDGEGRSFHPTTPEALTLTFSQLNRDFAVRSTSEKLIVREDGTREHYRLDVDPAESRPVPIAPLRQEELEGALQEWFHRTATALYLESAESIAPSQLPEDVQEKLRALGYVK